MDFHVFWQHRGQKGGNTDAEVNVHSVTNFLGSPSHNFESDVILARPRELTVIEDDIPLQEIAFLDEPLDLRVVTHRQFLYQFFGEGRGWVLLVEAVDVDCGHVDALWVQFSIFHYLFDLGDDALGSCCHIGVEVSLRLLKLEVSHAVSTLGLHQGEVSEDGLLHHVLSAVEDSGRFGG